MAATKLSESLELVRKMEGIAQQPAEVLNKARLFDEGLAKNPVTTAKMILVLVDFNQKMDETLLDMRALFDGLEVEGLVLGPSPQHLHQYRRTSHSIEMGTRDSGANTNPQETSNNSQANPKG